MVLQAGLLLFEWEETGVPNTPAQQQTFSNYMHVSVTGVRTSYCWQNQLNQRCLIWKQTITLNCITYVLHLGVLVQFSFHQMSIRCLFSRYMPVKHPAIRQSFGLEKNDQNSGLTGDCVLREFRCLRFHCINTIWFAIGPVWIEYMFCNWQDVYGF